MALIVEDGSQVASANSYVSLLDAQAIMDARGLSTTLTEALLLQSMDALDGQTWKGGRSSDTQSLPWPRTGVYLSDGRAVSDTAIPQELINSQIWLAYYIEAGSDPASVITPGVLRETVDVLTVEYKGTQVGGGVSLLNMPNVSRYLSDLLEPPARAVNRA